MAGWRHIPRWGASPGRVRLGGPGAGRWRLAGAVLPALLLLRYMTAIVGRIAALPGAHGTFFLNTLGLCLCYGVLCAFILALWHKAKYSFRAEQNPSEDGT